jgi:hypothetical protein
MGCLPAHCRSLRIECIRAENGYFFLLFLGELRVIEVFKTGLVSVRGAYFVVE